MPTSMAPERQFQFARPAHILLLALVALYPALWNGYPLVFSDSGTYIGTIRGPGAPAFYPIFVRITSLGTNLFLTIAAQALISATVIPMILYLAGGIRNPRLLFSVSLAVLLLNQMPFLVSWIMPDFLTGLGIAAVCLLVLMPERLGRLERLFAASVIGLAVATTVANVPLLLGLVLFCLAVRWIVMGQSPDGGATLLVAGTWAAASLAIVAANAVLHDRAVLSPASAALTFSRLADTNIAQPVVEDLCKTRQYAVCNYLDSLADPIRGQQTFLWDGVADVTGAYSATREEYAELNAEVLRRRWKDVLREGLHDCGRLFLSPTLGEARTRELTPYLESGSLLSWITLKFPDDLPRFAAARQQTGDLIALFPMRFFAASSVASYVALVLLTVMAWRRGHSGGAALGLAVMAAIFGQLLLHTMTVGPYPRYHVKVVWLGWLFAAVIGARIFLPLQPTVPLDPSTVRGR